MLGREISSLVDEVKEPGIYHAVWDGSSYPSGVYLCRMTAGKFVGTRKLILMK